MLAAEHLLGEAVGGGAGRFDRACGNSFDVLKLGGDAVLDRAFESVARLGRKTCRALGDDRRDGFTRTFRRMCRGLADLDHRLDQRGGRFGVEASSLALGFRNCLGQGAEPLFGIADALVQRREQRTRV